MIVRELFNSFLLIEQHEHALISGEFARRWARGPTPLEPTLYAVDNHDVAWREPDREVLWNEASGRPYSFLDYPVGPKLPAQRRGIDLVEAHDAYAGCLCSMHYARFLLNADRPDEVQFREAEMTRQDRLRAEMSGEEVENLERNFRFLRLCDGLSLFICLNEPGSSDYPPPTPGGFELDGERFEPVWDDGRTLRLDPNPFTESFDVAVPYREVGKDRQPAGSGAIELRISTAQSRSIDAYPV